MDRGLRSIQVPGRSIFSVRSERQGESMTRLRLHDEFARDVLPFPAQAPQRRKGDDPLLKITASELDATMDRMQRKLDELRRLADRDHGPRAA